MTPYKIEQSNAKFGPPPGLEESQVHTIEGYMGPTIGGSTDGAPLIVLAYLPSAHEIAQIVAGEPIFLTVMGMGLPPHYLSTDFHTATHPA